MADRVNGEILHNLDVHYDTASLLTYSFQNLCFFVANSIIIPVVVGHAFGFDSQGTAELVQRVFIVCGIGSLIQALWGHRFPLFEGAAGLWYSMFLSLAASAVLVNKPLLVLVTDLELALVASGLVLIVLGITGLLGRVVSYFSPAVNGTYLVMVALQLAISVLPGMLGLNNGSTMIVPKYVFISMITVLTSVVIATKVKGFIQSIGVLISAALGWVVSSLLGVTSTMPQFDSVYYFPGLFVGGHPTFDPGIILVCIITGLIIQSTTIVSVQGMASLTGVEQKPGLFNKGTVMNGITTVAAGLLSSVGTTPYASSVGFVAMTRVASRGPFILGAILLLVLGVIPAVGAFFAGMPYVIGATIIFTSAVLCLGLGLKEFTKLEFTNETLFIVGIPMAAGAAIMFIPMSAFNNVVPMFKYIVTNGTIVGVVLCMALENLIKKRNRSQDK